MICFTLEKKYRGQRAYDQQVHMQRHRMGARGNATSFPLPWQDLLLQLKGKPDLPHTEDTLSNFVSILLKTSDEGDTKEALVKFIHQALVRRDVVIELIANAKARGHRAYRHLDMERVIEKAGQLPEHGVPACLAKLIPYDDLLDKIQVAKNATPVPGRADLDTVAGRLANARPNGVVLEKSSNDEADIQAQRVAALHHFATKCASRVGDEVSDSEGGASEDEGASQEPSSSDFGRAAAAPKKKPRIAASRAISDGDAAKVANEYGLAKKVERKAISTGNAMIDQFEPWYFGVAFPFLFKYCTGMPDPPGFTKQPRYRREGDAPRVEAPMWVQVMARRIEAQLNRDWHFGFVSWNYLFRSTVNLSRTFYSYDAKHVNEEGNRSGGLTAKDLENGAIELCKALTGTYDQFGTKRKVNGDMTKLRFVPGLSAAASKLLQNIEHCSRRIAGTQETRRLMRFDTHANRIRYGVPIFVTFSPDEAHSLLMIRLSRTRRNDPVFADVANANLKKYCGRKDPRLHRNADDVYLSVPVADIIDSLPTYDERRKILARDALASVDGFRTIVLATYEYLFGMRVCPYCPDCNSDDATQPCQDLFGSSAYAEGGEFGRMDAGYTSIEAQKSTGSLHAHSQLFVQCLHQHTPLTEVLARIKQVGGRDIVEGYLRYKTHVCRQVYDPPPTDAELEEVEKDWPEYEHSSNLTTHPSYLTARSQSGITAKEWLRLHLRDARELQLQKQNHVHVLNTETGLREPLQACRRKDKPALCKGDFPRPWIIKQAVVLCKALCREFEMAFTGRKSKLGGLHGPQDHESINGTDSGMLVAHRFNSDVQLPYRFPISKETHCCNDEACIGDANEPAIIQAAQASQDAQAGYACDYCNKRQPMAFNEVKECCKGHVDLTVKTRGESISYIGKRHATRLMNDAYGKGIVRGQAENTNLRAYGRSNDVTAAETFRTTQTVSFFGREYFDVVQRMNDRVASEKSAVFGEVDFRNPRKKKVCVRDVAVLYGQRPTHAAVWYLSPYEFVTYWEPTLVSYPTCIEEVEKGRHHVEMTAVGLAKLKDKSGEDLIPGTDYLVREDTTAECMPSWLPYPDTPSTQYFRHTWILARRRRPVAPSFAGAPVPRHRAGETNRSCAIVMTYFHPWTLRASDERWSYPKIISNMPKPTSPMPTLTEA